MFLAVFLILFLSLVLYLLFVPIALFIDTTTNQYFVEIQGLVKVSLESHKEEILRIKLKVFFFTFYFNPLKSKHFKKEKVTIKIKPKKKRKSANISNFFKLLRSFKVKQFWLNIDTGNYVLNAQLYPLVAFLNYYKEGCLNINFQDKNELVLEVENRPIRIIKSFINI
ncbi:hypothetical protein C7447_102308 [Tenacibaculum adriaticum]|uniref:Uncharacterized protein n=1 Tax=Tenacibaculum adriaticum TaxID=413713 RepID=A0A5S5DST0_9FLAO|nr:hypothetical protein [Tenacibaculum adriaticum]TYP98990.1 hypothetical protein C7447_102308 [Tenacibaculum adriaticum]